MSIQGNVNQIIGLTGAALALGKKAIGTKKTAAPAAPAAPAETKQPTAENWLGSLDKASRGIYESLGDAAKKQVLAQAGGEPMRRDLANARAKSAIQNKKAQRDDYTRFMRAVAGKEE